MLESFPATPLFLNLITPYVLTRGVYGRIDNMEAICRVCKLWQEWIYSDEGPFSVIDTKIRNETRLHPPKWGEITHLNRILYKAGKIPFKIIEEYKENKSLPQTPRQIQVNYTNFNTETPLQKAIDIALEDISRLEVVEYFLKNGADIRQAVFDPSWNNYRLYSSYYVYIFRKTKLKRDISEGLKATTQNCLKVVDLLYKLGLSIHDLDINGNSLLHYYTYFEDNDGAILQWYIEKGGDINIRNGKGLTPLQHVMQFSNVQFVCNAIERLLQAGASCHEPTPKGDYLIHQVITSAKFETVNIVKLILKYNKDLFFAENSQGKTPLELAIKDLAPNILKVLFSFAMNSNLEITSSYQHLLLNELVNSIKSNMLGVWFFYDRSSDCVAKKAGSIELDLKQRSDFVSIVVDLMNQMTVKSKDVASLLNLPDELGNTFWHKLAYIFPKLIEVLCENFPEVGDVSSLSNNKGKSVLDLVIDGHNTLHLIKAIDELNVEMVETYLTIPTLNFHITDHNQNTLLHLAVTRDGYEKCYKIVKLLLNHGFNPNTLNIHNETPLDYCKRPGNIKLYTLLRNHGAKFSKELM